MVIVSAFKDGSAALRANPVLLFAGLLVGIGSQLQTVGDLIESPILSAGASLAWLFVFPFVLAGFIGVARAAIQGSDAPFARFVSEGRTYYVRILLGTILFVLLVAGAVFALGTVSFVLGIGSLALGAVDETAAFVAAVGFTLAWLLAVLVVIMFVQFYDTAIVVENAGVIDAFSRSIRLVRSNLKSVVGFSLLWVVLLNAFLLPEYLLRAMLTDAGAADVLPVDPGIPVIALLPIGIVLSAIGFAYFYTVYTAYYMRLIAASPDGSAGTRSIPDPNSMAT